jgi:nucleoside-diphosphate-sugar epimerase
MNKQNILVTGGAGYIGSVLCPALLEAGHKVTVLDAFLYRGTSLALCCANPDFDVVRGDSRNEQLIKELVRDVDLVIPLAALVGAPLSQRDAIGTVTVNRDAVLMLVKMLSKQQRIIFPTTNSGYGIGEAGKFCTEDTPLRPISLYGTTKVEAERAVLDRGNSITMRLATVFGMSPRMRIDLLVNDFVYRAVSDRALVVFEGHFKRNYIHVRDVALAFLHCIENFDAMGGQPYNVGLDDANLSKIELCQVIHKHVPGFVHLEAPIGEDPDKRDYIVSNARIYSTGFRPRWSLDCGVSELIKGYRSITNSLYSNV